MILTLPFPPSLNQLYGYNSATHKVYLKPIGKNYKAVVGLIAKRQMLDQGAQQIKGKCSVIAHFSPADLRAHDEDNLFKILYDTLTSAGIWIDDRQVKEKYVCILAPDKPGSLLLEIIESDDLLFHVPIPYHPQQ